jgi:hypothetical protein
MSIVHDDETRIGNQTGIDFQPMSWRVDRVTNANDESRKPRGFRRRDGCRERIQRALNICLRAVAA